MLPLVTVRPDATSRPSHRRDDADSMPLIALDFDGTVCVGDAPVWAYAEAVITRALDADPERGSALAERIRERLGAFLDGAPDAGEHLDGYAAVAALAAEQVDGDDLQAAYAASRRALAAGEIRVAAPRGLADLLADLGGSVRRVLVTNAPEDGIRSTLEAIGLAGLIDETVTSVGKPAGWQGLLPRMLAHRAPAAVMAVGDIWGNDLRPPLEAGCCTALIDRFGHRAGPAHLTGARFEQLYAGIRAWAADPALFAANHTAHVAPLDEPTPTPTQIQLQADTQAHTQTGTGTP